MIDGKRVIVVMPAYNASKTIEKTYKDIPKDVVDEVIVVDDNSSDDTACLSRKIGLSTFVHQQKKGYGGNQKTCYRKALEAGADIVVMLHPDYQYTPKLIPAMASLIGSGEFDIILGSRILAQNAITNGMPVYKYISNRFLTFFDNIILKQKFSEYHTGLRAFRRPVLENLPLLENSDGFIFDNQILVQAVYFGFRIGEVACPARYSKESSSVNFTQSLIYGLGVIWTALLYLARRAGMKNIKMLSKDGRKII